MPRPDLKWGKLGKQRQRKQKMPFLKNTDCEDFHFYYFLVTFSHSKLKLKNYMTLLPGMGE